jgi:hypothetical protein
MDRCGVSLDHLISLLSYHIIWTVSITTGLLESEVGALHAIYTQWLDSKTGTLSLNAMMTKLHTKVTPFTRKSKSISDLCLYLYMS